MSVALSKLIESKKYDQATLIQLFKDKTKELTADQSFITSQEKRVRPLDRMVQMSILGQAILK